MGGETSRSRGGGAPASPQFPNAEPEAEVERTASVEAYLTGSRFLSFSHAREFYEWFAQATRAEGGFVARALLGLCDRYYLLTGIIGRSDMLWHGGPGESVPAGNVWLYERCREVEAQPEPRLDQGFVLPGRGSGVRGPQGGGPMGTSGSYRVRPGR